MQPWKRLFGMVILLGMLVGFAPPSQQQAITDIVEVAVSAGFDGYFRDNYWLPLRVSLTNNGADTEGRVIVRPETSVNAVNSTFSTPVSLPNGSRKTVFLYITARSVASQIRVEFITPDGVILGSQQAALRSVQPQDQLYAVVSQSASGTVDLTGVRAGGYSALQSVWSPVQIPDKAESLAALDVILFSDVDSGVITREQHQALADWVAQGGHLIVTGGPNWQATAAGLTDLLPLVPDNSQTVAGLSPLSDWTRNENSYVGGQTVIATGTLQPGAWVMVADDTTPLIARRLLGDGVVDYLAADPNTQPLRGWSGLTDVWTGLVTSVNPRTSWGYPITVWDDAAIATNVLPGVNLLPDILPLCGFLAVYIGLVGPLNYLILNRLNRRELAWLTIPVLIVIFSAFAWSIGFNLRGTEVTFSRIAVVQSWPDVEQSRVRQLIGLLSPRRAQYNFRLPDGGFLRPITGSGLNSLTTGNLQISTDIEETDTFSASNFSVDASFIASFYSEATLPKPDISGTARLFYDGIGTQMTLRGSVRNDTDQTLTDPVILVRGQSFRLNGPLTPGAVQPFELTLPGEGLPSPAPIAYAPGGFTTLFGFRSIQGQEDQTTRDLQGDAFIEDRFVFRGVGNSQAEQETYRRRLFLSAMMTDAFNTTGRGDRAYLASWAESAPLGVSLDGAPWKSVDTTLYLTAIETEMTQPSGVVTVTADQFTWVSMDGTSANVPAPLGLSMQPGEEAAFRFTPLPNRVLSQVDSFTVQIDRSSRVARSIPIYLWDWVADDWDHFEFANSSLLTVDDPERYLGPANAVQVRIVADETGGFVRIQDLTVEQRGRF